MTEHESGHLLILVEGFYPQTGGGAQSQWEVAKAAVDDGYRVSVFTPKLSGTPRFETVNGVEIHRPFSGAPDPNDPNSAIGIIARLLFDLLLLPYLLIWAWDDTPAVIYSPSHLLHPVAKILATIYSLPVVNFVAYSPVLRDEEIHRFDIRRIFEKINFRYFMGDVVFSRTPRVKQVLDQHSSCKVIQAHGVVDEVDIEQVAEQVERGAVLDSYGVPADEYVLCWVGRFVPIKRPQLAVEIFAQLSSEYHLVMVGNGPILEETKAAIPDDLHDRIHFTGLLPHKEALQVVAVSDGLLLTSETEAYPTVVFEALALGTPVYATPVGVLTELSEDQLHVAESENLAELIRGTDTVSGTMDLHILRRYSVNRFEEDLVGVFDELSSSGSRRRGSQQT